MQRETLFKVIAIASQMEIIALALLANRAVTQQEKAYKKLLRNAKLNHQVVMKFVEYADPVVVGRIQDEMGFEIAFDNIINEEFE